MRSFRNIKQVEDIHINNINMRATVWSHSITWHVDSGNYHLLMPLDNFDVSMHRLLSTSYDVSKRLYFERKFSTIIFNNKFSLKINL